MATRRIKAILEAKDKASPTFAKFSKVLGGLGVVAGGVGAIAIGAKLVQGIRAAMNQMVEAVKVTADFQAEMSGVGAITGATATQMASLTRVAQELGRTTVFTARQAASAQAEFARAGFTTKEITGALAGTLDLAAAGQTSLADAASISANAIRAFGLEATDANDVADLLAKTANTSNQTVLDLGEAFKIAAPAAKVLGVNMTDASAAMAILADRGITASMAGTSLRKSFTTFLGQLDPTQEGLGKLSKQLFNARGEFVGMAQAIRVMRESGLTGADAFKIFGERAGNAMAILLDLGPEAFERVAAGLEDRLGFALEVADKKLDNLRGDTTKMASAAEGLQMAVGEGLTPALRDVTQALTEFLGFMTKLTRESALVQAAFIIVTTEIRLFISSVKTSVALAQIGWDLFIDNIVAGVDQIGSMVSPFGGFLSGTRDAIAAAEEFEATMRRIRAEQDKIFDGPSREMFGVLPKPAVVKSNADVIKKIIEEDVFKPMSTALDPAMFDEFLAGFSEKLPIVKMGWEELDESVNSVFVGWTNDLAAVFEEFQNGLVEAELKQEQLVSSLDATTFSLEEFTDRFASYAVDTTDLLLGLVDQFSSGIALALGDLLLRGKSFGETMKDVFRSIGQTIINFLVQAGVQAIATALISTSAGHAQHAARLGQLAAQTYASAFASIAAIPIVGPMLAPGIAAAAVGTMLAASTGAFAAGAGVGAAHARRGMIVPGSDTGLDTVPVLTRPGEAVLPTELTNFLLQAAGGGGGQQIDIALHPDIPMTAELLSEHVERGAVRLSASSLAGSRVTR